MQISSNFLQIYTTLYSPKKQDQIVKTPVLKDFNVQNSGISSNPVYPHNICFCAKSQHKFNILRSENAKLIPLEFQIFDSEAIDLIIKAKTAACANKLALGAKYTQGYHGVSILIKDKKFPKGKILSDRNLEMNRSKTVCGEIRLLLRLESAKMIDKVRALAISRPDIGGMEGESVSPCAICSSWLRDCYEENPNFKNVQYVLPQKCGDNKFNIRIMTLEDLLPQIGNKIPSYSKLKINKLVENNIEYSKSALEIAKPFTSDEIIQILNKAKESYNKSIKNNICIKSKLPDLDPMHAGAAVLTEEGKLFQGMGMGPKARMSDSADKIAITNAINNQNGCSKIKALAFYSEKDTSFPTIENLNWFLDPRYVTDDFQIIKIEHDKIKVYTTKDFMPFAYKG